MSTRVSRALSSSEKLLQFKDFPASQNPSNNPHPVLNHDNQSGSDFSTGWLSHFSPRPRWLSPAAPKLRCHLYVAQLDDSSSGDKKEKFKKKKHSLFGLNLIWVISLFFFVFPLFQIFQCI